MPGRETDRLTPRTGFSSGADRCSAMSPQARVIEASVSIRPFVPSAAATILRSRPRTEEVPSVSSTTIPNDSTARSTPDSSPRAHRGGEDLHPIPVAVSLFETPELIRRLDSPLGHQPFRIAALPAISPMACIPNGPISLRSPLAADFIQIRRRIIVPGPLPFSTLTVPCTSRNQPNNARTERLRQRKSASSWAFS